MPWRKPVRNNGGMPKWTFILYLAILGKLNTRDKLARWGVTNEPLYPLCNIEEESIEHLFFKCTFAASIWRKLLQWMGINRQAMKWCQEVEWAYSNAKGRSANAEIYRIALAGCVYYVLQERNHRIFRAQQSQ
uniref:Reverse transcriptase zinc-binding domain-containing protein n=1 Tax=Nicotiana tabacum TaxID=4097 RepID=A0A1S3ZZZ4_TOBAC